MASNRTICLAVILVVCSLAACGQKGALYLPTQPDESESANELPKVNQAQPKK